MPNVNLIEEEGGEEGGMQPVAASPKRRGGGGGSKVLLILIVVVVLGGGVFALNKFGIVKLWGKKQPPVITQIEEPAQEMEYAEADTMVMDDTAGVSFVETPPLTEPQYESSLVAGSGKGVTSKTAKPSVSVTTALAGMKGNYTIQVSAWRNPDTAQKYVRRLEQAGYPAYVEQRTVKDGSWYAVRIGRYGSMKEAKSAVESFAFEIKRNYWIDKVRAN
jgi:hypothetical protein